MKRVIMSFALGIILSITIVKATTYINANNVGYSGSLSSNNIQDAIDELYTVSKARKKITAWEYNENGAKKCINGEEDTCVRTECYKSGSTCSMGTVIKYYVNDNLYHYFYVLRDNGTTITMQQRENTVRNIPWVSKEDYVVLGGDGSYYDSAKNESGTILGRNDKGPVTILNALEKTTSTWTNVNVLEYIPGTTTLYENAYTGCTYGGGSEVSGYISTCSTNTYTLSVRKARARMITVLEASSTGCLVWKDGTTNKNIMGNSINTYNQGSCPDFMHNYLYQSTLYGGSYNDNTQNENGVYNYHYWTMSAGSGGSPRAWRVFRDGALSDSYVADTGLGARAIVEITKSNL